LYNFDRRDYSPTLMRWTQSDPTGFGGQDTNLYRDVGNGPTNGIDPTGLLNWRGAVEGMFGGTAVGLAALPLLPYTVVYGAYQGATTAPAAAVPGGWNAGPVLPAVGRALQERGQQLADAAVARGWQEMDDFVRSYQQPTLVDNVITCLLSRDPIVYGPSMRL